jgi:hypothetical protein
MPCRGFPIITLLGILTSCSSTPAPVGAGEWSWRTTIADVEEVPFPSASLLGGVRLSAGASFAHARPTIDPATRSHGFEFPLRVQMNRVPGLLCTVTAVEPAPPLRVCGGFTRLVGHDPEDPARRVVLQLLAARCAR